MLDTLEALAEHILGFDREIRRLSTKAYPETVLLNQVGGVGPITALRYVLTIEDPTRIKRSRNVGAYFGLRPKQRQSGQRDPEQHLSPTGDGRVYMSDDTYPWFHYLDAANRTHLLMDASGSAPEDES